MIILSQKFELQDSINIYIEIKMSIFWLNDLHSLLIRKQQELILEILKEGCALETWYCICNGEDEIVMTVQHEAAHQICTICFMLTKNSYEHYQKRNIDW